MSITRIFVCLILISLALGLRVKKKEKKQYLDKIYVTPDVLAEEGLISSNSTAANGGRDVLFYEKIGYTASIVASSASMTEVIYYRRSFESKKAYTECNIQLEIPFTGPDTATGRARIILTLDDVPIADSTVYGPVSYILEPIHLNGYKMNVTAGTHFVKLMTSVDKGSLMIPHYNPVALEATDIPLFSTMHVACYK